MERSFDGTFDRTFDCAFDSMADPTEKSTLTRWQEIIEVSRAFKGTCSVSKCNDSHCFQTKHEGAVGGLAGCMCAEKRSKHPGEKQVSVPRASGTQSYAARKAPL